MSTLLLERPSALRQRAICPSIDNLIALRQQLESWLPAQEEMLWQARERGQPRTRDEAEWQDLLHLYERLCVGWTLPAGATSPA